MKVIAWFARLFADDRPRFVIEESEQLFCVRSTVAPNEIVLRASTRAEAEAFITDQIDKERMDYLDRKAW